MLHDRSVVVKTAPLCGHTPYPICAETPKRRYAPLRRDRPDLNGSILIRALAVQQIGAAHSNAVNYI
jgi:hypothetical protein